MSISDLNEFPGVCEAVSPHGQSRGQPKRHKPVHRTQTHLGDTQTRVSGDGEGVS